MKCPIFISLLLIPFFSYTQNILTGQIIDAKTKQGLAYVNIGIVGKNIGTVSAFNGDFRLKLPSNRAYRGNSSRLEDSKLKISMVGYRSISISLREFKKKLKANDKVMLFPATIELPEVIVFPKFNKTKTIGNKMAPTRFRDGFDEDVLGREGGIIVKLKKKFRPAQVLKFRVYIAYSTYDSIKFRLNFYDLKDKFPDQKLIQKDIIISSAVNEGAIEVDLEKYNIIVKDNFGVTIEWIEDFGRGNLLFCFRRFGARCVYRYTSQANWIKYPRSPAMNVTIGY